MVQPTQVKLIPSPIYFLQKEFTQVLFATGIAFQPTIYDQSHPNISESVVVTRWQNNMASEPKVPSEISYSINSKTRLQWGSAILPGSPTMTWTKLQLDQQDQQDRLEELKGILKSLKATESLDQEQIRRERGLPSFHAKEPVDIVADYLSEVRQVVVRELRNTLGHAMVSRLITDIVITVPAVFLNLTPL
jgi:hypothetical protein